MIKQNKLSVRKFDDVTWASGNAITGYGDGDRKDNCQF
jgi:hypothetical protein